MSFFVAKVSLNTILAKPFVIKKTSSLKSIYLFFEYEIFGDINFIFENIVNHTFVVIELAY